MCVQLGHAIKLNWSRYDDVFEWKTFSSHGDQREQEKDLDLFYFPEKF